MSQHKLNDLIFRIRRLFTSVRVPDGEGLMEVEIDGICEVTRFEGCKSPQEQKEQIERLAIYIWNLKDHLRERLTAGGGDLRDVEDYINVCRSLPLCGDLANGAKHSVLRDSRSGRYAHIPEGETKIRNRSGFRLTRNPADENTFVADDPEDVEYDVPVLDKDGNYIDDALSILTNGFQEWEHFISINPLLKAPS